VSGHTAERGELLGGRKVILLGEVVVLEASLALGVEVGGRSDNVLLRMLALGVTRGVYQSGVQADGLLGRALESAACRRGAIEYLQSQRRHQQA